MTWRRFEYSMFIPSRLRWNTTKAQEFADLYADFVSEPHKPIVFDLATKGRGSRYMGMHRSDRISLSLELDTDDRWRTLIHELAHYGPKHGHGPSFIARMKVVHQLFRQWSAKGSK